MPVIEERQAKIEGILEQIDKRIDHLESDINELRREMCDGMNSLRVETNNLRTEMLAKIDTNFRWLVGIMITMWVTIILGIISIILTIIFKA